MASDPHEIADTEIAEFRDVTQLDDGTWRAVHRATEDEVVAGDFAELRLTTMAVRCAWPLRETP
ncbi:hypothetical protein [Streptosporangium sp. KLBMP 9127]|nr:hypothetical protein [Streptosporangium sp. KLBMP 9127]